MRARSQRWKRYRVRGSEAKVRKVTTVAKIPTKEDDQSQQEGRATNGAAGRAEQTQEPGKEPTRKEPEQDDSNKNSTPYMTDVSSVPDS